jgi:hypothetical protein
MNKKLYRIYNDQVFTNEFYNVGKFLILYKRFERHKLKRGKRWIS